MAYVNWSPPDDEIPGTFFQGYVWLICTDEQRHNFLYDIRRIGEKRRTLSPLSHAICYLFEKLKHFVLHHLNQRKWSSFVI